MATIRIDSPLNIKRLKPLKQHLSVVVDTTHNIKNFLRSRTIPGLSLQAPPQNFSQVPLQSHLFWQAREDVCFAGDSPAVDRVTGPVRRVATYLLVS